MTEELALQQAAKADQEIKRASSCLRIMNFTGHPCVVLLNSFQENGGPTSISFTGKLFGEAELLSFAKTYQDQTKHHWKHPKLID